MIPGIMEVSSKNIERSVDREKPQVEAVCGMPDGLCDRE